MDSEPAGHAVLSWLHQGDWARLRAHFAQHAPATADEYAARALLVTQVERSAVATAQVLADWRRACVLRPGQLLYAVNLAQALLDAGEPQQALEQALLLERRAPQSYPVLEKLALAWTALGRWEEARPIAQRAEVLATAEGLKLPPSTRAVWADLTCTWWRPQRLGVLTLRLPEADDLPFLATCFGDAQFMRRYHRFQSADPVALPTFLWRAQRPPREVRRRDWLVQGPQGQALGLAALVDLDFDNARGELLIGLPGPAGAASYGFQATLAVMDFAFERLGLAKLLSYVYADNPRAQANTLHLGFAQEGLLRAHVQTAEGRLDLHLNGLLRQDYQHHALLQRALRRWRFCSQGTTP